MRRTFILSIFAFAGVIACSKTDTSPVDSALAVGATAIPLDSMSDLERAGMATTPALVAPAPVTQTPSAPRRTTRRSSGSSGSSGSVSSGSSRTTTSAPAQTTTIKKNTKRDAAIGAAAGAVIGAATSDDKVKGAVIGGVVGGVIGGVIGNNVDVQKKKK